MATYLACFVVFFSIVFLNIPTSSGKLTPDYYNSTCPPLFETVRAIIAKAIALDTRMGASLLRLHFHDCWVNGCDGSVLLVDTDNFIGEQSASANENSLRGFDVIADINTQVNTLCPGVVSCADILAIAAQDSVNILVGPLYQVLLGRLDSLTASKQAANEKLPSELFSFTELIENFAFFGFGLQDLVILSGAHTIGMARCDTFRSRIYNDKDINSTFADQLKPKCPNNASVGGNNMWPLDTTTILFDTNYYQLLTEQQGLLHSDQELYSGGNRESADLVTKYSNNQTAFWGDFVQSIIKMGNLMPPAGSNGQVRCNCSVVNPYPPTSCPSSALPPT